MKRFSAMTALVSAGLLCGGPLVAQAVERCFEVEIRTSPVHARTGERLDCRVLNITEDNLWIDVKHKDADDDTVKSSDLNLGDDEFGSSTYVVPFPYAELVCEVEVDVCYETTLETLDLLTAITLVPPVKVYLVRRDNERDEDGSEGAVTEIEEDL